MKEEQLKKLDTCYYNFMIEQRCEEEIIPARQLLGSSRFDLYAILLYIDHKVRGVKDLSYAKRVYSERTRAITGLTFKEEGNAQKRSLDDFFAVLDRLIEDFKNGQYDEERTLIPVDKDYELIDGAHRVSCAAYFDKKVKVLHFLDAKVSKMTSEYLLDKLLPPDVADSMALESIKWHDNLFVLFLWPKSFLQESNLIKAKELIYDKTDVIYDKSTRMTYQAIRNLMIQIYGHMDWVGNIDNDFSSTYKKADEVWSPEGLCEFFLVKAPSTQYVLDLKSQVRDIFQIGLSSIHSTDNQRETNIAVNALFNSNSFHFINTAKPTRFKSSYKLLQQYKKRIQERGLSENNFIVDSSMVLAIAGAREANDLDYYTLLSESASLFEGIRNIEEHDNTQKQYYNCPVDDLILNPNNYFWYDEIKFVAFEQLMIFKQNRYKRTKDSKDANDIKMLEIILSGKEDKWEMFKLTLKIKYKRLRRRTNDEYHHLRANILKKLGLYDILKQFRNKIKKK